MIMQWACQRCSHEFDVTVLPFVPARTYGPPEHCYPAEPGEVDPDVCPSCGHLVDEGMVQEAAAEEARDRRDSWLEAKADARREGDT